MEAVNKIMAHDMVRDVEIATKEMQQPPGAEALEEACRALRRAARKQHYVFFAHMTATTLTAGRANEASKVGQGSARAHFSW